MAKVKVVTAYTDLNLSKRPALDFHQQGIALQNACWPDIEVYQYKPDECWTWYEFVGYPPANARAEDRFADEDEHRNSNLIQHAPVQWLRRAYKQFPDVDTFVWMGYSLLKQGDFTGKRVTEGHVKEFLGRVRAWEPTSLPFPGIAERAPVSVNGDNWRFCGSTLIVPREYVLKVEACYKACLREFVRLNRCIPLDLAIWPLVEQTSGLPWEFYPAEYDHTQLTNFPC